MSRCSHQLSYAARRRGDGSPRARPLSESTDGLFLTMEALCRLNWRQGRLDGPSGPSDETSPAAPGADNRPGIPSLGTSHPPRGDQVGRSTRVRPASARCPDRAVRTTRHRGRANSVSLRPPPRLTVIAGMSQMGATDSSTEFVGALEATRDPGIHLELVAGSGNRLRCSAPAAPTRVIDVDHRTDVTQQFSSATGSIDLLSRAGETDVPHRPEGDAFGSPGPGRRPPGAAPTSTARPHRAERLWSAAGRWSSRTACMEEEAGTVGFERRGTPRVIERIERHHEAVRADPGRQRRSVG